MDPPGGVAPAQWAAPAQESADAVARLEQKLAEYDSDNSEGEDDGIMLSSVTHVVRRRGGASITLTLKEDVFGTLASFTSGGPACWSGGHVWHSSRVLADYLSSNVDISDMLRAGVSVLELGSGCGLLGLSAMALGGDVTLTDQTMQIPLLKMNTERNFAHIKTLADSALLPPKPRVAELTWGDPPAALEEGKCYSLVIGSDLFYIPGQATKFTETLLSVFQSCRSCACPPPLVLLAHGSRADSFHDSFFHAFKSVGLTIETVSVVNHDETRGVNKATSCDSTRNRTTIFKLSVNHDSKN